MIARTPRRLAVALITALVAALLSVVAPSAAHAAALPPNITDGGFIISDAEFFDSGSMSPTQVQEFLVAKVPTCTATTGPTCLRNFKADLPAKAADQYCRAVTAKTGASAAHIIVAAARACGVNPKVILVMLQKEQSLVTSTAPSDWSYRAAMGQSCPDTAPCSAAAAGFVNQVYLGARQQQVYTKNPTSFNYRAGQVNTIKWHPTSSCGTSRVFIENQATANLYIYTPYRPNIAALAAGYGTGDSCSTYGNRNFYNYYVTWFAPGSSTSTGAPAQVAACAKPAAADVTASSGTATAKAAVTVRTAPTNLCASGALTFAAGEALAVTGIYGAWVRGNLGGSTYWIPKSAVTITATPADSIIGAAMYSKQVVHLRASASSTAKASRTLITGTKVTVSRVSGGWTYVTAGSGKGWVELSKIAATKTAAPATRIVRATASLDLRMAATTAVPRVSIISKGTSVVVIDSVGSWRAVKSGSKSGWVHSRYLGPLPTMTVTASLNLRADASTKATVLAVLAKGSKVSVIRASGVWRKVIAGGRTGWVAASYLR